MRSALEEAHKQRCDLRTRCTGLCIERDRAVGGLHTVDEAGGDCPVHGILRPIGDGGCIREGGELILRNGLGLGEAIEHRGDLLTGNGHLGSELVGADALDDTGFRRPLDGVGIPDTLGDILERIGGVLHIRLAGYGVQHHSELRTGHRAVRLEQAAADAEHELVVQHVIHALMIPLRVVQVGEGLGRAVLGACGDLAGLLCTAVGADAGLLARREAGRLLRDNPFAPVVLDILVLHDNGLAEIKAAFRIALQRLDLHLEVAVDIVLRTEGQICQNGVAGDLLFGSIAEEKLALGGLEARELRRAHTGDIVHQGRIPGDFKQAVRRGLVGRQGQVHITVGGHGAALHGSDALRVYLGFGFNYVEGGPWNDDGIKGIVKWLERVERVVLNAFKNRDEGGSGSDDGELLYVLNSTIKAVTDDYDKFSFNTAVARMMELVNAMNRLSDKGGASGTVMADCANALVRLLAPLAPHIAEELWENIGEKFSVFNAPFPVCDQSKLQKQSVELAVQINSKIRGKINVSADADKAEIEAAALNNPEIAALLDGKSVKKVIIVPNRLVNLIV